MKLKKISSLAIAMILVITSMVAPAAAAASASRTLPGTSVSPGANFNVAISASGYGFAGQVTETLPAGFEYVSSTLSGSQVDIIGNTVKFTLFGETSFTYVVKASGTAGTYIFSGIVKDFDNNEIAVGGNTQVVVSTPPSGTSASRTLPGASVDLGANFNVAISASGYGLAGQVTETLPAGFEYVSSTLSGSQVDIIGNTVKFTLFGETSFTYVVKASGTAGTYTFSGILKDIDNNEIAVGGNTQVVVSTPPSGTSASRTLPGASVDLGANFDVAISASGYGLAGRVTETLPAGFEYVSSTMPADQVDIVGNTVEFILFGESSFTYVVKASGTAGTYSFSGILKDIDNNEIAVGGNTQVVVSTPPSGTSASRSLPATTVDLGANFDAVISASGYGLAGRVTETLPAGFEYVSSTMPADQVDIIGNTVEFILFGETSFTYTVKASGTAGTYTISGILKDIDNNEVTVSGDTRVIVSPPNTPPIATVTTPANTQTGDVTIGYTLLDDQSNSISITVEWKGGSQADWTTATVTGETSGLSSNPAGAGHSIIWNSAVDAPHQVASDIQIRITPSDTVIGTAGISDQFSIDNNEPPVATVETPSGTQSGDITIAYTLSDAESDTMSILVEYKGGLHTSWTPANTTGNKTDLNAGSYTIVWNSRKDVVNEDASDIQIRITPSDAKTGTAGVSGTFQIKNKVLLALQPGWNYFSIPFELSDPHVSTVLAGVQYDTLFTWGTSWTTTTTLDPLKGYIIHVTATTEQTVDLTRKEPVMPSSINLKKGFNLIGFIGSEPLSAECALNYIDTSYQFIFEWVESDFTIGYNGPAIPGTISTDDFEMNPTEAYWILMKEDATLLWIG